MELSVCICTRNRPAELARCLDSIARSSSPVSQVIVSDDGDPGQGIEALCAAHDASLVEGPKRGLCANRNTALDRATGTHVLFLDDDAELAEDFVALVGARLDAMPPTLAQRTIVTGREQRPSGHITEAREQTFLGFQEHRYEPRDTWRTVVINAAVFPRELLEVMRFDEQIVYGYDEVDLTTRAVAAGWSIVPLDKAVNRHEQAEGSREGYSEAQDATRLYVTFKRYLRTESAPVKAAVFALLASAHVMAHAVRRRGLRAVGPAFASLRRAVVLWRTA